MSVKHVGVFCAVLGLAVAQAEDLTIEAGASSNFVAAATYGTLRVEGCATVDKVNVTATNVVLAGGSVLAKGTGAQFGSTKQKDESKDCVFTVNADGVCGKIAAEDSATAWLGYVSLRADPKGSQPADGYLDFLSLSNATMMTRRLFNYTSLTGRVTVAGDCKVSHPGDGYDYNGIFQTNAFEVALRDNARLTFDFNNQKAMLATSVAQLRFTGSGDVTVMSGTNDKDGYYFTIPPQTSFEQDGELTLTTCSYENTRYLFSKGYAFSPKLKQLNLKGYYASLRAIMVVNAAVTVTLPPKTVCSSGVFRGDGTIRLDATERDVSLTGPVECGSQLTLEKIGEHGATVASTNLVNVLVKAGTLRLTESCVVAGWLKTLGTGKVVVDGCTLYLRDGFCIGSKIETVNGGRVVKIGEGTFTGYAGPDGRLGLSKTLRVQEGTFNFSLAGCPAKRWRLTLKKMKNSATDNKWFTLNRIWLFDANGDRVGGDMKYLAQGQDISKGKVQFVADETLTHYGTASWMDLNRLAYLFTQGQETANKNNYPELYGLGKAMSVDDPTSWVTIEWWLNDSALPVTGYNLGYYSQDKYPTDWDLCMYDDDTATWVPVDVRRDFVPPKDQSENWMNGVSMGTYVANGKVPPPEHFRLNSYVRPGLNAADAPNDVRVDRDAKLDFSSFTEGTATVERLTVSTDGAGVLTGGAFAASGTLSVLEPVAGTVSIPIDLGGMSGLANLANWKIHAMGIELQGVRASYDPAEKALTFTVAYVHFTENTTGDLFAGLEGPQCVVEVDVGVVCTNTAALTGSQCILKTGAGTLVMGESSPDYAGTVSVGAGALRGPVTAAFGTGLVEIVGSTKQECRVILGSTTQDTVYDNDFVLLGDSSRTYPAISIYTIGLKKTTLNGSITAYGALAFTDIPDGKASGQNYDLHDFNGDLLAPGQQVEYLTETCTRWKGRVVAGEFASHGSWPCPGSHYFYSPSNAIGRILMEYNNAIAMGENAFGGAQLVVSGGNKEAQRAGFRLNGYGQTISSLVQTDLSATVDDGTSRQLGNGEDAPVTVTITGGVARAVCKIGVSGVDRYNRPALESWKPNAALIDIVVDANDGFTQVCSNSIFNTKGSITVKGGAFVLNGTTTATNVPTVTVTGGTFALESTAANAMERVGNISVASGATLRVTSASATTFGRKAALAMEEGASLDLPAGAEVTVHRADLGGVRLAHGDCTGEGGPATAEVVPWISGTGVLHVKTGPGMAVILR